MSTAQQTQQRHRAEQLASALPPLLVAAERVASTVAQGVHGRRRVGTGETFWQFRQYQMGDSASAIDWRQSAKSDRTFVRENEWEAAQSVWLWCDASASMHFQSAVSETGKFDRAALLSLALSVLLIRGGEYITLMGSGLAPATGRATLTRLAGELLGRAGDDAPSLPAPEQIPRAADVVLISDFLSPMAEIEARLRGMAAGGLRGTLVQVLDPAEVEFPFSGHVLFNGLEGEEPITIGRADNLRTAYVNRMGARHAALSALAGRLGWAFLSHQTDHRAEPTLLALYLALAERLARVD